MGWGGVGWGGVGGGILTPILAHASIQKDEEKEDETNKTKQKIPQRWTRALFCLFVSERCLAWSLS